MFELLLLLLLPFSSLFVVVARLSSPSSCGGHSRQKNTEIALTFLKRDKTRFLNQHKYTYSY